MEKRTIWMIIVLPIAVIGVVFLGIFLFAIFDEAFWARVILFGWDHFYTFVIIMAVVFLTVALILAKYSSKKLGPPPTTPVNP
jgi:membrane protein implicated in regulation of membrane protease activity